MKDDLSEKLKQFRVSKGLTQKEVADKIFVSRTTYNKWENGNSEIPLSKLKTIISKLDLKESEVLKLLAPELMSAEEKAIQEPYEKIIGYFKTALRFAFSQIHSEYMVVATGNLIPFNEFPAERKQMISAMNERELTEEEYNDYYAYHYREFSDDDYYSSFVLTLNNNPLSIILFQFGLFEEQYQDYWERYKKEYELAYEFFLDQERQDWQENFIKTIQSINKNFDLTFSVNWKHRYLKSLRRST